MNTNQRPKVLVVDDEMAIRHSLLAFLDRRGYETFIAASAEEAETLLSSQHIDAAVIDLGLPGENGGPFIRRTAEAFPSLRFLIYTGSPEVEIGEDLAAAGVKPWHIFHKPVKSIEKIVDALDTLLCIDTSGTGR